MTVQDTDVAQVGPLGAQVGRRIRVIRRQQGLSLQGVETRSDGQVKAVVIGSYERGDRGMTTAAIERVAEALRVTPEVLMFGGRETAPAGVRLSFDLAAVRAAPAPGADPLRRWLMWVAAIRGDRGGRVLTVRGDDLRVLAILHDTTPAVLIATFTGWGVLLPSVDEDDGEAQQ